MRTRPQSFKHRDVLIFCQLAAEFLNCTADPRMCWKVVGFGMRAAQDIGLHRIRTYRTINAFEYELKKRASAGLVLLDTQLSTALGRGITSEPEFVPSPCRSRCVLTSKQSSFDPQTPTLCDDQYWGPDMNAETIFRQPPGQPSTIAFFELMLHLNRIIAMTSRILVSTSFPDPFQWLIGHWNST